MKRNAIILTACMLILAMVLGVVAIRYNRDSDRERLNEVAQLPHYQGADHATEDVPETTEKDREQAPDFTVYDAAGKAVSLKELRGKPVVVGFWASWSPTTREQIPALQAAYNDYKDTVHFLMVNLADGDRETREAAQAYIAERGYTLPFYYDTDGSAAETYEVDSLPTTFFIDPQGQAIAVAAGRMERSDFERGLAMCYHKN